MKNKNILDYWPFDYEPRQNQIKALEWIEQQDAKYVILEAPVGSGKSNIGITYSRFLEGNSFILTPQRILQQQYEDSFKDVPSIKLASLFGKSNYRCASKNSTCDVGSIVKPSCYYCPFQIAKKAARQSPNTVLNYRLALTSFAYTETFTPRTLMVLDECHTLESTLVDFDALQVSEWRCKKYNIKWKVARSISDAQEWMKSTYLPKIQDALNELDAEYEELTEKAGSDLTRSEIRKLKEFEELVNHVDEVLIMSSRNIDYIEEHFVLVHDKMQFQFKRLSGAHSFHRIVKPKATKFLFMSSTVLNKDGFCRDLGIEPSQAAFLSLESEFPTENRPVYYMPQMKMNAKWKEPENQKARDNMSDVMAGLLHIHNKESGIIHTGNFKIAEHFVNELEGVIPHKIFHHNPGSGDDRNAIINAFMQSSKPSVLISPSCTEGLDLKDDLGRFVLFAKIPFGFLGDQWIKRKQEMSNEWYQRRALIDVIQGGGRIVRSSEDSGSVYILDQSWAYLFNQTRYMVPDWWKNAYQVV